MKKKILIVDDDLVFGEQLGEMLEAEGYKVSLALDGFQALTSSGNGCYDVCLLDLKLEVTDGADLLKTLKGRMPGCKVVVVSGRPGAEGILEGKGVSHLAEFVVAKPFSPRPLLERLKRL